MYSDAKESNLLDNQGRLSPDGHGFLIKWMNTDRVIPPSIITPQLPESVSELVMNWLDPNPLVRGNLHDALEDLINLHHRIRDSHTWLPISRSGRPEPSYDESSRRSTTTFRRKALQ